MGVDVHWQKISKEAKDLISKLLIKNPAQRITCENAMKHPWFEPIREEQQRLLIQKTNENKLVIIDEQYNDEKVKKSNKKDIELYPDDAGRQSVRDIKIYGSKDQNEADVEDEEDSESDDEDNDSAPIAILRQKSVQDEHYS